MVDKCDDDHTSLDLTHPDAIFVSLLSSYFKPSFTQASILTTLPNYSERHQDDLQVGKSKSQTSIFILTFQLHLTELIDLWKVLNLSVSHLQNGENRPYLLGLCGS